MSAPGHERYRKTGLVVIGVHAPEFAFERDPANVRKAVADLGIRYPVALDNDLAIWRAFDNRYWPAHYLADAQGRIRYHHFGEGSTDETEAAIRALLAEKGAKLGTTARVDRHRRRRGRRLRRDPQPRNLCRQQPRPILRIARRTARADCRLISCRPIIGSMTGAWPAAGQSSRSARCWSSRAARSPSASAPATSTSYSAARRASRCDSA